jgi:hypothetical protein
MTQLSLAPAHLRVGALVRIPNTSLTFRIAQVLDFGRVVVSDRPLGPDVVFRLPPDQWRYVADGLEVVEET